ncbi:MAG: helix-turn-helix domain-containing protein [Ruminococcus sp.]|nr:helix-turn-helix domain-containing protein [Ruminococcus sp.]
MSKTIKQIADELGIPKQRVYRYIKSNHISEAHQERGVMYYDDVAETAIKSAFSKNATSNEAHQNRINDTAFEAVIDTLKRQLEVKDKQIEQLQRTVEQLTSALAAAQALNAADKQQLLQLEDKHGSLWSKLFGRKEKTET